jgi:hypothetical protein
MNRSLYVRGTMVEDGQIRELVIVDGVVADASPMPSREPDAVIPEPRCITSPMPSSAAVRPAAGTSGRTSGR